MALDRGESESAPRWLAKGINDTLDDHDTKPQSWWAVLYDNQFLGRQVVTCRAGLDDCLVRGRLGLRVLTFGHVRVVVIEALLAHFAHDPTMITANERTRVARLLVYLDRHVSNCEVCFGLNVDSEYSRVGSEFTNKELSGRRSFPDLLIHRRTVQAANVLAAEVKLRVSSRPRRCADRKDQRKIDIMTGFDHGLPDGMLPYQVGLCLNLDGDSAQGWWTSGAADLFHEHDTLTTLPSATIGARRDIPIAAGAGDHN